MKSIIGNLEKRIVKPLTNNKLVGDLIHGRNDYSRDDLDVLKKVGEEIILGIQVIRTPVNAAIRGALNIVSMGKFQKRMNDQPYDKLYHLAMLLKIKSGVLKVEKNEVVNIELNPSIPHNAEEHTCSSKPISVNAFLDNGKKQLGTHRFFDYNAWNNNCQDFILGLLKGNGLLNEQDKAFIKQDTDALFKGDKVLKRTADFTTELGERANILENKIKHGLTNDYKNVKHLFGRGLNESDYMNDDIYSIMPIDIDRIRIIEPHVEDQMAPPSRSIAGGRIIKRSKSEAAIAKAMDKIGMDIEHHHSIHGGKIGIARAFKHLGSRVKTGFHDIEDDAEREIREAESKSENALTKAGKTSKKYVTNKHGGLSGDLITYGIPAASGATFGSLAGAATLGNPLAVAAASALGSKLGAEASKRIHKAALHEPIENGPPSREIGGGLSAGLGYGLSAGLGTGLGGALTHVNDKVRNSLMDVESYSPHQMSIESNNPFLHGLSTEDIKSLKHLQKVAGIKSKEEMKNLEKTRKSTRARVSRELKEMAKKEPKVKKVLVAETLTIEKPKRGRMVKGSKEAMEWAAKMKAARAAKKAK